MTLVLIAFAFAGFAQMPLPTDPNVRIGKLDNGLTYYIRHNEKPAQRAEFYIAQKVGAILEEENQRGLAHFLEHMCFNGTKNYPGKSMLNYLEGRGVKFGTNVNAYTGVEQTVYLLTNVPTTYSGLIDSCLLVLHDWSSFVALEDEEIDAERGVILEELRTRNNASQRMMEATLQDIYPNSPYATRLPGGLPEVVANFEYKTLRDYYHKWYRPDLQGIIVVGDINVDDIEARIKRIFSDIPAPINPAERTRFEVADNQEPIISIHSDKEAVGYQIRVFNKQDVVPNEYKSDISYTIQQTVLNLISSMYIDRMNEISHNPNAPFSAAYGYYGNFYISDTKDAWTGYAAPKTSNDVMTSLAVLLRENNRMKQFGFTVSEYERAKANMMKDIETAYQERANEKHEKYVDECLNHFLQNEPMPGIETEYALAQQLMPNIPVEAINQFAAQLVADTNLVIVINVPEVEGESIPTKEEVLQLIASVNAEKLEAYAEEVSDEPLIAQLPKAGKVVKEKAIPEFEATEWTLKNGMRIIYKQTKFKEDEIRMNAYSWGGTSVVDNSDFVSWKMLPEVIDLGGVGNFDEVALRKKLAGKDVRVSPFISQDFEGMTGKCSVKDLETMMQLVYLYFTAPRADKDAFDRFVTSTKAQLQNLENNPMMTFQDSLTATLYDYNPLSRSLKAADIDKINYDWAMKTYKERFADPNNFTFCFVGNIDVETFRPLVEQYLGSLKKKKNNETWKDLKLDFSNKNRVCNYERDMETPKSTVYLVYNGAMDYTLENDIYMEVLGQILDIVYTEEIREKEGGTYGVSSFGMIQPRPVGNFYMLIGFDTNKESYEKLKGIAYREIENIAKVGPRPADLQKVKEYMLKDREEKLAENGFWMSSIIEKDRNGINNIANYNEIINSITVESMAQFTAKVIGQYKKEIIQSNK